MAVLRLLTKSYATTMAMLGLIAGHKQQRSLLRLTVASSCISVVGVNNPNVFLFIGVTLAICMHVLVLPITTASLPYCYHMNSSLC